MKPNLLKSVFCVFVFCFSGHAYGIDTFIRPDSGTSLNDVFFNGNSTLSLTPGVKMKVHLSCFGANLRSVANPITPMGAVRMYIGIGDNSDPVNHTGAGDFSIIFPGWMSWSRGGGGSAQRHEVFPLNHPEHKGSVVFGTQTLITVQTPAAINSGVTFDANNQVSTSEAVTPVHYLRFYQDIMGAGNCWGLRRQAEFQSPDRILHSIGLSSLFGKKAFAGGGFFEPGENWIHRSAIPDPDDTGWNQAPACTGVPGWDPAAAGIYSPAQVLAYRQLYSRFTGKDGILSGTWHYNWSSDYKSLEIFASFPGEYGYCGGYFSPLMMFWSSKRPLFNKSVNFENNPGVPFTKWPEYDSSYGFLVLDKNKNGLIDSGSELFGTMDGSSNGFDELRKYDENHDGKIDPRDKAIFSQLRIWKDSTEKALTLEKDLYSLKQLNIQSIDLNYKSDQLDTIGTWAELRERSTFQYTKNKKKQKGQVIDVWLSSQ